jgi:hypothetical protein
VHGSTRREVAAPMCQSTKSRHQPSLIYVKLFPRSDGSDRLRSCKLLTHSG